MALWQTRSLDNFVDVDLCCAHGHTRLSNAYVWCALESEIAEISAIKVLNGMEWNNWLAGWLTDSLSGWLSVRLTGLLTGLLTIWLTACWLVYWLTDWLYGWLDSNVPLNTDFHCKLWKNLTKCASTVQSNMLSHLPRPADDIQMAVWESLK